MPGYVERHHALRPLGQRDFRLLLAGAGILGILMPLHLLTQLFWVSERYPERAVLYTSILAAAKGAGMVSLSLVGGAIADRANRKTVLMVCETLSLGAHAAIAVLMILEPAGELSVAFVAVGTFIAAGIQSVDSPARSASLPGAAGPGNLAAAIALLSIASQVTMPLSLPVAGILNEVVAPGAAYAITLLAWAGILPLIAMLRLEAGAAPTSSGMLSSIRDGVRYVRGEDALLAIFATVAVVQLLGMPVATPLGPMFEIDVLGFTPMQVGLMGATWGLGSLTASMALAKSRRLGQRGATLAVLAGLFGVAVLGFGYSRAVPLTAISDFGMGLAFTGTLLVASTLVQQLVSDAMRGRVLSLFPFSMGLAQVSIAVSGLAGEWLGLATLIPALGWGVLLGCSCLVLGYRRYLTAEAPPAITVGAGGRAAKL